MEYNRTGVYNTGLGLSALRNSDSSSYNTAIGITTPCISIGKITPMLLLEPLPCGVIVQALEYGCWKQRAMDVTGANSTSHSSVAVGFRALRKVKTGIENTAVGVGAMEEVLQAIITLLLAVSAFLNKRGDYNTSMGINAARVGDTASYTTFIGSLAGYYNKSDYNTGIGMYSLTYTNLLRETVQPVLKIPAWVTVPVMRSI